MPKLWTETLDSHRAALRKAALDATAKLVAEHGVVALTMSQIAEEAGIGRATLYKYFPDAQAVLTSWHEREITTHLDQLVAAADPSDPAAVRLEAVLQMYAQIQHHSMGRHGGELAHLLHRGEHVDRAQQRLRSFVEDLITEAARAGDVRGDVASGELAGFCVHALTAASKVPNQEAVQRLIAVTLAGLRWAGPEPTGVHPGQETRQSSRTPGRQARSDIR